MITVAATAPSHRDTEFVFRTWINKTGWESNVICFITGLVNPLYSLGGLDGISHITEEMPNVRATLLNCVFSGLRADFCVAFTKRTTCYWYVHLYCII